jgi:hypothetical protein
MSDSYDGITTPDPERERLCRSVFRPSPLEDVAEAISVATEQFPDVYVERRGDLYRWSLATRGGGAYVLLRLTAKYFRVDYLSVVVGFRQVGDGWCVQMVDETYVDPDAWAVLRFDDFATVDQVRDRIEGALLQSC